MIDYKEIINLQEELSRIRHQYWLENNLFSLEWWILLLTFLFSWLIGIKFLDRKRTKELLVYGLYISIISSILDTIGVNLSLWTYPIQLVQVIPILNPFNLGIMPISYILVYQYTKRWTSFLINHLILSLIFSFGAEPLLVEMNIYKLLNWRYLYSLPIYLLIALLGRYFLKRLDKKNSKEESRFK